MTQGTQLLTDNNGNVVTAFHGTYYDFDYFFPLTHFGTEYAAKRVLNEGKWKRDKNININKPKIIPVNFKRGNYVKIPDLNNHYTDDWQAIILALLLDKSIIDDINSLVPWKGIEQKCNVAATKELPYQYDFIREQIAPDSVQQELSLETLYSQPTNENLFYQRMILFLESVGINGFTYPNFTEGGGRDSYIILRQNNVVRLDKNVPLLPIKNNITQLQKIENAFAARYQPRQLSASEIQIWIKKLHDFYDFKTSEIALQKHKAEIITQQK